MNSYFFISFICIYIAGVSSRNVQSIAIHGAEDSSFNTLFDTDRVYVHLVPHTHDVTQPTTVNCSGCWMAEKR